ncbi:MAG: MarR-family transcriptional regulator [Nocardia sp.]|uniref:MarR family winged helix-turn-helix transcriptional regulator n=1 Tax=Nocardia sp. TaxID=1821 RepID=UPI0026069E33|nr:MarR family transcriptional regulator [Nocardia sp.]MCU1644145.1 MarR-family transcriptional regulator [Nocardia sp.]
MTAEPERVGLHYLAVAYQVRKALDGHMAASGLSLARTKMLDILAAQGPLRQAALAEELGLAQRSVTQAVESLARDGLIERAPDPDDGRAKLVAITPSGAEALAASSAAGAHMLQQVFGSLTAQQLAALDTLLEVVDGALDQT